MGNEGVYVDDIYYCPHHPDKGFEGERPELKKKCYCRKPNTGMIEQAAEKYHINVTESIVIGDTTLDIKLARNAGAIPILVKTGEAGMDNKYDVKPDFIAENLEEAVDRILKKGGIK